MTALAQISVPRATELMADQASWFFFSTSLSTFSSTSACSGCELMGFRSGDIIGKYWFKMHIYTGIICTVDDGTISFAQSRSWRVRARPEERFCSRRSDCRPGAADAGVCARRGRAALRAQCDLYTWIEQGRDVSVSPTRSRGWRDVAARPARSVPTCSSWPASAIPTKPRRRRQFLPRRWPASRRSPPLPIRSTALERAQLSMRPRGGFSWMADQAANQSPSLHLPRAHRTPCSSANGKNAARRVAAEFRAAAARTLNDNTLRLIIIGLPSGEPRVCAVLG